MNLQKKSNNLFVGNDKLQITRNIYKYEILWFIWFTFSQKNDQLIWFQSTKNNSNERELSSAKERQINQKNNDQSENGPEHPER